MKAVRFHAHGGPDVLRLEDVDDPTPGPGEALVRVRACALNHLDLWQRRGMERVSIPFPHISGADVAGEVLWTPNGEFKPGRRVMLQPGLSCGRCGACVDGRDNECARYDVLGYRSDGGYADSKSRPQGHPRSTGTFPRVLGHYVRDMKLFSLEEAVRRMTSLPADFVGLRDRGRVQEGLAADLALFDPATVTDRSTWDQPQLMAVGIPHVIVNGVFVLRDGKLTGRTPGRYLRAVH